MGGDRDKTRKTHIEGEIVGGKVLFLCMHTEKKSNSVSMNANQ